MDSVLPSQLAKKSSAKQVEILPRKSYTVANKKRIKVVYFSVDEGRKRVLLIAASILAARKLSQYDRIIAIALSRICSRPGGAGCATDSTVLIEGETGTGKELIALAIHNAVSASTHILKLNCAAIPLDLLKRVVRHEKGAFTGAIAQKIGRFGMAIKVPVLDEVGDILLPCSRVAAVLQEQEFERLGVCRTHKVDVGW